MTTYIHSDILDNGLNEIKNKCTRLLLLNSYPADADYYSVLSRAIAFIDVTPDDFVIYGSRSRCIESYSKYCVVTEDVSDVSQLHIAGINKYKALFIMETTLSNKNHLKQGDGILFPSINYLVHQPV